MHINLPKKWHTPSLIIHRILIMPEEESGIVLGPVEDTRFRRHDQQNSRLSCPSYYASMNPRSVRHRVKLG